MSINAFEVRISLSTLVRMRRWSRDSNSRSNRSPGLFRSLLDCNLFWVKIIEFVKHEKEISLISNIGLEHIVCISTIDNILRANRLLHTYDKYDEKKYEYYKNKHHQEYQFLINMNIYTLPNNVVGYLLFSISFLLAPFQVFRSKKEK